MLPWIASQTVTRLRGVATTDDYNNTVLSWVSPNRLIIEGCSVQGLKGNEFTMDRDAVTSMRQWFGDEDADVEPLDRIEYKGVVFDVDGDVPLEEDPSGDLSHKHCFLKRVTG